MGEMAYSLWLENYRYLCGRIMKQLFIIMALIVAGLCSCSNGSKIVILAAEESEYYKCCEVFPDIECIKTGVGAGNIIKACCNFPKGTRIINIGYAGSNNVEIGTVSLVELNFIASFLNNAIRESGVLTSDEVWANVRQAVETILSRNQDKKR